MIHIIAISLLIVDIYIGCETLAEETFWGFGAVPNVIYFVHVDNYLHILMRLSLFDQWGARNSTPIWNAFRTGLNRLGIKYGSHDWDADVAVIWSVVWAGRMRSNHEVWHRFRNTGRPVMILEVGSLHRGQTWKLAANGLGLDAVWGRTQDFDRPRRLGLTLTPWHQAGEHICVATQRHDSQQWQGQPAMHEWLERTVRLLSQHTDRPIHVRMHPRQRVQIPAGAVLERPRAVANTYDDFDFDSAISGAWAVVNWNSGAAIRAAMLGVPVFVGSNSLAAPVGNLDWNQIHNPCRPDREQWLIDISHTEWTREEIQTGDPIQRILLGFESL